MKLYKYRPISDLLYKELYYGELFFASYPEPNDPLDLSARMNFKPIDAEDLEYLFHFIGRIFFLRSWAISEPDKESIRKYIKLNKDHESIKEISNKFYMGSRVGPR